MPIDPVHLRRITDLDLWPGSITVDSLAGGITNHNYLVKSGRTTFVARLCEPRERLGIDRRNEVVCHRAAHAMGLAPAVIYHGNGVLVSEYLAARVLGAEDVREPAFVPRLAATLRTLHGGWDRLNGEALYFSAFQTVRTYAARARELGGRLPVDIDDLVADARRLAHRITPFVPVLCHNDLLPANILDDGERVWLIDWEYAGVGHPLFDLAGVSANCGFSDDLDAALVAAYRETPDVDPRDLRELQILKAMSLLREALWSVLQSVDPSLAFDYEAYANRNFLAYRDARRAIDIGPTDDDPA